MMYMPPEEKIEAARPTLKAGYIYIYYIHPELKIGNYRSGTGKGAGLF